MTNLPDVPEYGKIEPKKGMEVPESPSEPNQAAFESYMQKGAVTPSEKMSPMELAQRQMALPTNDSLLNQINQTHNFQNDVQEKLRTPNLSLKDSHQKLLNTKLSESFDHLQNAAEYAGANRIDLKKLPDGTDPITKFLGYVTSGENQLLETKKKLEDITAHGKELKAAEMLLVQTNLAQAQQGIEFSSVLLSKIVDALKQTLSIQL